jgi:hypothetical protein
MESSPIRLLLCGLVCFFMVLPCVWLHAGMTGSELVLWGEGSVIAVVPRHDIPPEERFGDGPNATIKRTVAMASSLAAFVCLFVSLVLPLWAAARLIADALHGPRPARSHLPPGAESHEEG